MALSVMMAFKIAFDDDDGAANTRIYISVYNHNLNSKLTVWQIGAIKSIRTIAFVAILLALSNLGAASIMPVR